jgi:tetratricopeptide (TPR) repeat protein
LGVMDQIIHRLPSSPQFGVLQTDDVLAVMKRAQLPEIDLKRADMDSIFSVSGATLIVASNLSGNINDYQLIYNLHRRNSIERGVILGENITVMANQLAALVSKKIDLNLANEDVTYHSDFANEMLAAALNKINNEDFGAAKILLTAAKEIEPDNLVVSRHLAQMLILNNQLEDAQKHLFKAITQATELDNNRELARLRTILSQSYLRAGKSAEAIDMLMSAQRNAQAVNDWLYLGYIASTMGKAYQYDRRYMLAAEAFESSINYHKVIQCPFGQAQGFVALAELALSQDDHANAQRQIEQSLSIIEERELVGLKETALEISRMINAPKT